MGGVRKLNTNQIVSDLIERQGVACRGVALKRGCYD